MYGKIFDSMYEGTLYGNWEAIVTFQQMIVLCDADGIIDMTPQAIAARTSIPFEIIKKGIAVLEAPDQYSRTPDQEGRRIELIDAHRPWGWHIVNHEKYKNLRDKEAVRDQNRIRQQRFRDRKVGSGSEVTQSNTKSRSVTQNNAQSRHTDTNTNTRTTLAPSGAFDRFWTAYPRKKSKGSAEKAWLKIKPDEQLSGAILAAVERAKTSADWQREGGQFIPYPATWLNAKGWEDDGGPQRASGPSVDVGVGAA